jgi:predicted transcriptional regulator
MDVLYKLGEADVASVREHLPDPPGYSAVRAMLVRLEDAGHIHHREEGAKYIYVAKVAKDNARQSALRRLINTFFGGSGLSAASALLDAHASHMSDEELNELEEKIKNARRKRR